MLCKIISYETHYPVLESVCKLSICVFVICVFELNKLQEVKVGIQDLS